MAERSMRKVAILGGTRIPFCRSHTAYAELSNLEMLTRALGGLVDRFGLHGAHIDEVIGGAVVTHAKDWNLAREAVIGSALAPTTPAITMMQACGTSLQGALQLAAKIATGQIDSGIAIGSDTTSDAPIVFKRSFAQRLVQLSRAKSFQDKLSAFKGFSPAELAPQPPSTSEPRTGLGMGEHCELMAKEWGITREEQDRLAFESHRKAAAAYDEGFMDDLVIPCAGVFRDNNIREDISLEKMAELKPVFDRANGTITAANSTPLTDGAATVLLASEEWARERGIPVQAYLTLGRTTAVDFVAGEGLLMAPAVAVSELLRETGLNLQDFDYLRDPRSLCRPGARDLEGLGECRILPRAPRAVGAARRHRPRKAQYEGVEHRHRPSLCRHRRPHPRRHGQTSARGARETRPDFDLHRRRNGCRGRCRRGAGGAGFRAGGAGFGAD